MLKTSNFVSNVPDASGVGAIPSPGQTPAQVFYFQPVSGTTAPAGFPGSSLQVTGTVSTAVTPASGAYSARRRTRFTGGTGSLGTAGLFMGHTRWFKGVGGGIDCTSEFGLTTNFTGARAFVGFGTGLVAAIGAEPSALLDCFGIGFDSTDASTGNWFLIHNDASGAATKTDLGAGMVRSNTAGYLFKFSCPPGTSQPITWSIANAATGAIITAGIASANLPTDNTLLNFGMRYDNTGAVGSSATIDFSKVYITANY